MIKRFASIVGRMGFLVILSLISCNDGNEEETVLVEGLYINEIYASGEDWIELYNSLDISKDISGYFIYDNQSNKYTLPSGTSIPAKGFLVLLCNDLGTGLNTNFKLTSSGETVFLENASGVLIDRIEFPELSAGQSYGRYPDGSGNLSISGATTKGVTNGNSQAPAIVRVERSPVVPALNQSVTITTTLASNFSVSSVTLFHRFNAGAYAEIRMSLSGSVWIATIPASSTTGKVEYYVEATGTNGKMSYEPAMAPGKTKSYLLNTDPLPQLFINEFMAFNTACCPDQDGGMAEFDDWIEIYNAGSTAIDVGGMYLSDNKTNPFGSIIPADNPTATTIPAGGYLVLWADNSTDQGPLHLNFGLSNAGDDVGIYYLDGRTIDEYTFGAQNENKSMGRTTDGASTWKIFNSPTPGQKNQ
ncbi:MAG: lamin tail domain-containing protein [Cyclobacteriaceae bacterium]|nr:lamin tail domain-containing protein [Cyclobacteriaceae bacterium]